MGDGRGRPNRVPKEAILKRLKDLEHPCVVAKEVAESLDITEPGMYKRLRKLQNEGLVGTRKLGQARAWWLTEEGEAYLAGEFDARELDDPTDNDESGE